jgi:hypothetical protein
MKVAIILLLHDGDRSCDPEDVPLEREPPNRERSRPREADQVRDGRGASRQQTWPVLERLDAPPLDAAGERRREVELNRP